MQKEVCKKCINWDEIWKVFVPAGTPKLYSFGAHARISIFLYIFCTLWSSFAFFGPPFGSFCFPFGSFLAPFGSLLLALVSLWLPIGSLLLPFGSLLLTLGLHWCWKLNPWGPLGSMPSPTRIFRALWSSYWLICVSVRWTELAVQPASHHPATQPKQSTHWVKRWVRCSWKEACQLAPHAMDMDQNGNTILYRLSDSAVVRDQ